MKKHLHDSDLELLSEFKMGSPAAFKVIYERYWQLLYVAACKVLKDEDEAEDVVQEVFVSLLNKRDSLELSGALSSYLFTSVRYKVFDFISRKKVRLSYEESINQYVIQGNCNTDQALIEKEINATMEQEIQNLPKKMKEVFELSRKSELSHKEIATALNISDKTVKKQISNALKLLKPRFTNYYLWMFSFFFWPFR